MLRMHTCMFHFSTIFISLEMQRQKYFFLNYYKSLVWAIYQKLGKEGFDVKYIADQQTPNRHFTEEQQEFNTRSQQATGKKKKI